MKTIDVSQATGSLGEYARALDCEPLVLTDGGQPIAALLPIDEADMESIALGTNPKFLDLIERARAQRRAGAGLSTDEVRRELGLP
jgi:antitoxin (DNA-binding transcriptional repressor) of toxin-antitoxin stability system